MKPENIEDSINEEHGLARFGDEEKEVVKTIRQTLNYELEPCDRCVLRKYAELIQLVEYNIATCRGLGTNEGLLLTAMLSMIGVSLAEIPNNTTMGQIIKFIEISRARRELEMKAESGERVLQS